MEPRFGRSSVNESHYAHTMAMARSSLIVDISRRIPTLSFFCFLALCILGGGSSRPDVLSQPLIWLLSILCCGAAFWFRPLADFRPVRSALIFVSLIAAIIAIQLIPLPPSIWTALPGRGLYAQTAILTQLPLTWHPISLTPDLTRASLFAILPTLATVVGFGCLTTKDRQYLLPFLLIAIAGSAVLGLAQLGAGSDSALRYYPVTNSDSAVGVFANRNHNALFLVLGFPMLTVWSRFDPKDQRRARIHVWVAAATALFLLPMIVVTGSRGGVLLTILALGGSLLLARSGTSRVAPSFIALQWPRWVKISSVVLGALVVAGLVMMSRAPVFDKLFAPNFAEEARGQMLIPLWKMLQTFFPFGSGFGSFDPVFRAFEPFDFLNTAFMNHAHNDLLHIVIEGGLPAALLLIAYLFWWASRVRFLWMGPDHLSTSRLMGRLGTVMTALMLLASLADYPLRMPLLGVVFMIATLWMVKVPDHD